jgi:hypothetical protein
MINVPAYRDVIEKWLSELLQKRKSHPNIEKIKHLIFEASADDFHIYLQAMLSAFDCDADDVDDDTLTLIQDAWNYFSHRFLGGRCPAEVMQDWQRRVKKPSRKRTT